MKLLLFIATGLLFAISCKKDSGKKELVGQWVWTIQYANNPQYNSTPQSTGVREILILKDDGTYQLTQNGVATSTGTYKTSSGTSRSGQRIPSVVYTNNRVTDSAAYYSLENNNDTLIFSNDLIGTVGSGARYYGRQ